MTNLRASASLLGCVVALAACDGGASGGDTGGADGGPRSDTGILVDASPTDGGGGVDANTDAASSSSCALPVAFDVGLTYARELHVSASATGGDGSIASPFGSIRDATRAATPGTRIVLAAGTYHGTTYIDALAGTATQPIAIVGDGDVILDADGAAEVMHLSEASYVVLEHLVFTNATGNGLNIDDGGSAETPAHHVVLRDLEVHDIGTGGNNDCIKLSGLDDYFILDSRVSQCDAGDAIDHVGCHQGFIHNNTFADSPGGGIQMKGGCSDILVHGNRFTDIAGRSINAGGSTGLEFFRPIDAPYEAARLRIEANAFVRSGESAIAFVGCDACVFANNDVFDPQHWVARILQETVDARFVPSRDGLFVNNIVVFDVADLSTFVNVGPNTAPETFTFGNNLWFATDDPGFTGPTLTDGIPPETGSVIQMDPGVTESSVDLCLDGRPASTGGRVVDGWSSDASGRCWHDPPSIGAIQALSCTL